MKATLERTGALPAELDALESRAPPAELDPGAETDLEELALQAMLGNGAIAEPMPVVALVDDHQREERAPPPAQPAPLATGLRAVLASLLGAEAAGLEVISDAEHDAQLAAEGAPAAVRDGALVLPTSQTMPATPAAARALLTAVRHALAGEEGPVDGSEPVPPPGFEEFVEVEPAAAPPEAPAAAVAEAPEAEEAPPAEEKPAPSAAPEEPAPEAGEAPGVVPAPTAPPVPAAEPPGFELLMPPAPSAPGPAQTKRLEQVSGRARGASRSAAKLPSAGETTAKARAAVEEPKEETAANARAALAAELVEHPPPNPAIVKLCAEIRAAIKDRRPVKEEELTKTEPQGVAEQVGNSLNATIDADVKGVKEGYAGLAEPPQGKVKQKGVPLAPPPPGLGDPQIGAEAGAPDPIPEKDLSLEADQQQVAQRVEESGINRPTTEPITEPPFSTVREGQAELAELAKETPAQLAANQQQAIADAEASMSELQMQAVNALRASRRQTGGSVAGGQKKMVGTEEEKRAAISGKALTIFNGTRDEVSKLVSGLPARAMTLWKARVEEVSGEFKATLAEVQSWIDDRHSGVTGWFAEKWDDWTGFPGWVTKAYNEAEKRFGDRLCTTLEEISADVDKTIAAAQALIEDARKRIDEVFKNVPAELETWAAGERAKFNGQLDALSQQTFETRDKFVQDMSRQAIAAVTEVQQQVEELREKAKGRIRRIAEAIEEFIDDPVRSIINGLLKLVGIPPKSFWDLVEKIKQAIDDIADDPVGFLNNLVDGLREGFSGFFDRFPKHLLQGFWDWLFSGLGSVGVKLPTDLSPLSLVTFCLQLMGITWPRIREILVKHIGEENVELIERAWEIISTLIEQGPAGIVAMIKERLDPRTILDEILDAAVDYMVEAVVKSVSKRLLLLFNPAGAVIQAIELIYRIGKWIFQNAARIFRLVETVVNGIVDIIAGNVSNFAKAVEKALGSLIPPVIDFIADYFGLGDLPIKVADVIKQLQKFVLKIIDELIGTLVEKAKKLLASLLGEEEEEGEKEGPVDEELGRDVRFSAAGELHHQWIALSGDQAVPMVASAKVTVFDKLAAWEAVAPETFAAVPEKLDQANALINDARTALSEVTKAANALTVAFAGLEEGKTPPDDSAVEAAQGKLSATLAKLYELFKPDPEVLFAAQLERVHPQARTVIVATLKALKELPLEWDNAKESSQGSGALAPIYKRPFNQGTEFGDIAHIWGTIGTETGVNRAFATYPTDAADKNAARRVLGVKQDLWNRGLLDGQVLDSAGAEAFFIGYKGSIHAPHKPFATALDATQKTIWDASEQNLSESELASAFFQRVLQGAGPSPPPLPDDVRAMILAELNKASLSVDETADGVYITVDGDTQTEVKSILAKEATNNKYGPPWVEMLKWWEKNIFKAEFHHAWPKWLGGAQEQTKIFIPRALHNLDTLAGDKFPGGFHQVFVVLFREYYAIEIDKGVLQINDEKLWKAWVEANPGDRAVIAMLLRESYVAVFGGFAGARKAAIDAFIEELGDDLPKGSV